MKNVYVITCAHKGKDESYLGDVHVSQEAYAHYNSALAFIKSRSDKPVEAIKDVYESKEYVYCIHYVSVV